MSAKSCDRRFGSLFPSSADNLVPEGHLARYVVNSVARLDIRPLAYTYSGRGLKPYDPGMMLSILMYAYMVGTFSSREIEEALKDSVSFMFIANNLKPDHVSISRFRERALPSSRTTS
jgi:transposase